MFEKEIESMIKAAYDAEVVIKDIYSKPFDVEIKSDNSPVTAADKGADALIRKELHASFPGYAFLTEESVDDKSRLNNEYVFIVDPVDGTKEFVSRNGEFCTNIGLSYNHEVVAGVINIPMLNVLYYATKGGGCYRLKRGEKPVRIHVSDKLNDLICLRSRSFFNEKEEALIEKNKDKISTIGIAGAALKFCRIAEGAADISFRCSANTKEWDVCAGDIILSEAGGLMLQPNGKPFGYNRVDVYNRDGYMLLNRKENFLF